jgi:phenylpropionate dioxygenase-like ring-hydroxylating dioxygenase large terminal subunit
MLVTRQPVLRRFWYPVLPRPRLAEGPKSFTLLGEPLVLWQTDAGEPVALADRCCHRSARLSEGWCEGEHIVCGYHGWTYDRTGQCVRIPQQPDRPARGAVRAFHCRVAYDYVWVCLDEPLADLPQFEEEDEAGFRRIDEFYEVWQAAGLRVMENSFDNAHFSFVHRGTFGNYENPIPADLAIQEHSHGFLMTASAPVKNPDVQQKLLNMDSAETVRHMRSHWYMPFGRKLQITYPNRVVHSIVTYATPIDDRHSQICQFVYRNDGEADAPAADTIAFDRQVTLEDKTILESTDYDVPLNTRGGEELHMPSDKPGLIMRQQLARLLADHGEVEARRPGREPVPQSDPVAVTGDLSASANG